MENKINTSLYKFESLNGQRISETLKWFPYDTKELFNENIKKYSDSIHLNNFLKNPIEYKLNN